MLQGSLDIELLKEILGNKERSLCLAKIQQVEYNPVSNKIRALCLCYPDDNEIVAEQIFPSVGPSSGWVQMVQKDEMVLIALVDKDHAFIIGRLSSSARAIPLQAQQGHSVIQALPGKKAYLSSDSKVLLGKGGVLDPAEPVLLGSVLIDLMTFIFEKNVELLDKLITGPVGLGNLGNPVPLDATLAVALGVMKTEFEAAELEFLTTPTTNIVSQTVFVER